MKYLAALSTCILTCCNLIHAEETTPPAVMTQEKPVVTQEKPFEIHYSLKADGREWKLIDKLDTDDLIILQYAPESSQKGEMQEALTVFYMKDYSAKPDEYFDVYLKELRARMPDRTISSKVIKKDQNSFFGEWWIAEKTPHGIHEWVRIFSEGKKNFAIIKFSTTKMDEVDTVRTKWEDIIGNATYN